MKSEPHRSPVHTGEWCLSSFSIVLLLVSLAGVAEAKPYQPSDDAQALAEIPASARHAELTTRELARTRVDVALRLAQLYITQARSSGDLRFLGYADALLQPWLSNDQVSADALVLHATVLQSRHEFASALQVIDRALQMRADDPQAWLTRATILRVLGRYPESLTACEQLTRTSHDIAALCTLSLRGLSGDLPTAYAGLTQLPSQTMPPAQRAWRDSELGEMAARLGRNAEAEHWFQNGLRAAPEDTYLRAAYADLLLSQQRSREALLLLAGRDSSEPLLLRIAIAQQQLRDPGLAASRARLSAAFAIEAQRGEGIHGREQARFLLEVQQQPRQALQVAISNWQVQRETDDVLVLVRAAQAAGALAEAEPALQFARQHGLQDVRLAAAVSKQR
jgi:tetratricopeptide (TPR) repeat protein